MSNTTDSLDEIRVEDEGEVVNKSPKIIVPLGEGLAAWLSPEDSDIASMGWRAKKSGSGKFVHYYALHSWRMGDFRGEYNMHTLVWERAHNQDLPEGMLVDHINRDKLDNRRSNLRLASRSQNEANKRKRRTQSGGKTTSRYKGVSFMKDWGTVVRTKPWRATITVDKKIIALGVYSTEEEAARVYNEAAKKHFGEYAYLNIVVDKSKKKKEKK
jgi:hypothetical protein